MKLHLGCGQTYLDGYRNIDLPPDEREVQQKPVADEFARIETLRYPEGSIEEVRLHHVFEHFPRPVAIALVASWRSWLRPGGVLHIEVPDFSKTARAALSPFSSRRQRLVAIRHLFGSHEATWAVHCEGWTSGTLSSVLKVCGFQPERVRRGSWRGTYNIHVIGTRDERALDRGQLESAVGDWFSNYLLDDSPGELRIREVWMTAFRHQLDRGWAPAAI